MAEMLSNTPPPLVTKTTDFWQSEYSASKETASSKTVPRVSPATFKVFHQVERASKLPESARRVLLHLRDFTTKLTERELMKHISTCRSTWKYSTTAHVLRANIYLASNNCLDSSAMNKCLKEISHQRLLWIIEILLHSQLPTVACFADLLFQSAVAMGDTDTVCALLAQGIDPNGGGSVCIGQKQRPLKVAIEDGDKAMVLALLGAGAKVNNSSTLYTATGIRHIETDLETACKEPQLKSPIIRLLLQHGADIDIQIPYGRGFTSVLNRALQLNEIDLVQVLLAAHASLGKDDEYGQSISPLQMAATHCDTNVIQLLLKADIDVNIPIDSKYSSSRSMAISTGNSGFFITPLQRAAQRNDVPNVETLLFHGASVDGFDYYQHFPDGYQKNKGPDQRFDLPSYFLF